MTDTKHAEEVSNALLAKISGLEKEIVALNTYVGQLENELNNHKALQGYIKDQPSIETCRGEEWDRTEEAKGWEKDYLEFK